MGMQMVDWADAFPYVGVGSGIFGLGGIWALGGLFSASLARAPVQAANVTVLWPGGRMNVQEGQTLTINRLGEAATISG